MDTAQHSAAQRHTRLVTSLPSPSQACHPRLPAGYVLPSLAHVCLLLFLGHRRLRCDRARYACGWTSHALLGQFFALTRPPRLDIWGTKAYGCLDCCRWHLEPCPSRRDHALQWPRPSRLASTESINGRANMDWALLLRHLVTLSTVSEGIPRNKHLPRVCRPAVPGCCAQPETSLRGLFQWSEAHCGTQAVQVTSDVVNHSLFQVPAVLSKPPPDGMPPVKCRAVFTPRLDGTRAAGNQRQPEWRHCKSVRSGIPLGQSAYCWGGWAWTNNHKVHFNPVNLAVNDRRHLHGWLVCLTLSCYNHNHNPGINICCQRIEGAAATWRCLSPCHQTFNSPRNNQVRPPKRPLASPVSAPPG